MASGRIHVKPLKLKDLKPAFGASFELRKSPRSGVYDIRVLDADANSTTLRPKMSLIPLRTRRKDGSLNSERYVLEIKVSWIAERNDDWQQRTRRSASQPLSKDTLNDIKREFGIE